MLHIGKVDQMSLLLGCEKPSVEFQYQVKQYSQRLSAGFSLLHRQF